MFKDNTVFVIGAGASREFNLPTGAQLVEIIKKHSDFSNAVYGDSYGRNSEVFMHLQQTYYQDREGLNLRIEAASEIRRGIDSAESIDEFIFRHADNPCIAEVGKLQIAHAIANAEKTSLLGEKNGFYKDISEAKDTWIWTFFKSLIKGVAAKDVERLGEEITIICFNYDRCIEHYLEHALQRTYGMSAKEARDIVNRMNIIHPYGTLGKLSQFAFGRPENFANMAPNIITWSETVKEETLTDRMTTAIDEAERIVFLGFGFADQNMQLMNTNPADRKVNRPRAYASAKGLHREAEESMKMNIHALHSQGIHPGDLDAIILQYDATCSEFFDKHRFNLQQ